MSVVTQPNNEHRRGDFTISCDQVRLDLDVIHSYLTNPYWAEGISRELASRSIENSLCFGLYLHEKQVGFARVISDYSTYAYIADVFVLEGNRGKGLSKWMMECILQHPGLQNLRRWSLVTRDAHGLYAQLGFIPPATPERYMELVRANIYTQR